MRTPVTPGRRGTPTWRDLVSQPAADAGATPLALGAELRMRGRPTGGGWGPARVRTATARDVAAGGEVLLGLRPLMRSPATGNWIKGQVSWDAVRRPGGGFDPAQARWMAELHGIARQVRAPGPFPDVSEWLTLDAVASELIWTHLERAAAHGIPLVAVSNGQSVRLAPAADASVVVEAAPGGALRVRARIRIDEHDTDAAAVHPVGSSGLYAVEASGTMLSVTLAPATLAEPVRTLLSAPDALHVPAAETAEFLAVAYPRIARHARVMPGDGVRLPDPEPPGIAIEVRYRSGRRIDYDLMWSYGQRHRRGWEVPPGADADPDAEAASASALRDAWETASDLPFAAHGRLGGVDAAEFATVVLPVLERTDGVSVTTNGRRPPFRALTGPPLITVATVAREDPDWFDLGVTVAIDGHVIPFRPLFTALATRRTKLLLVDGSYLSLRHPALDRLRELIDEAVELDEWETGPRISRYQTALWADFEDLADVSEPALAWRALADGLRDVDRIEPTPVPAGVHATLRPYQKVGYDWLAFLWRHRLGGVLADDMGLGKTLQILALIAHARVGEHRPFLVVAPTSVVAAWVAEAARFTPRLRVQVADTTAVRRGAALAAGDADIVLTSYAVLRLDADEFAAVEWVGVVLDEAQFVKNPATKLHRAVAALRRDATFAITGTPMENSLSELWAVLSLTAPGLFPSARRFREEYIGPIEKGKVPENQEGGPYRAARLARLRRRIRPLVLRRTKDAVAADLPPKQEQRLAISLLPAHRALYDTVLQRERQKILGLLEDLDRNRFIVFRSLTLLRMLALAPVLVDPAHGHIPSAKLDALLERVTELSAEGHRALVFSQFTSFLSLAAHRLDAAGVTYAYLDGSTRRRGEVVAGFRAGDAPVFLISLKAGGFGLTLTESDYVFLLDPWWNPAAEAQAVDRTHRIGQHRNVFVYRMVAEGTIEEKVVALQERKQRLFRSVMDEGDLFAQALTADDIRGMLER